MKPNKLFILFLLIINTILFAQEKVPTESVPENEIPVLVPKDLMESDIDSTISTLNNYRWRIEILVGDSKGVRPYKEGYFSSNSQEFFGLSFLNSIDLGATYTYSRLVDFKSTLGFDKFSNKDPKSLPFEVVQFRFTLQGQMDLNSLFKYQKEYSRFKLLFHAGFCVSTLQNLDTNYDNRPTSTDLNGGFVFGFSPMFRITKKAFVFIDFSSYNNYRQHRTWDGNYSDPNNNLFGQMINGSIGLSFSLGKRLNWDKIENKETIELTKELEKRIDDIETLMNDTDKDGVQDFLDVENNSITGVAVDTKGRMIDTNKNSIPDELEKIATKTTSKEGVNGTDTQQASTTNNQMISKLINEGYVTVYFDYDKTDPTNSSTEGIDFMLTYLRNNPEKSIEIFGNADELGNTEYNNKLANDRAENVKKILLDAGIKDSRLDIVSRGEDKSVNPNSALARRLVRKVSFKIK